MTGILEMFAEFDGRQRYEDALFGWAMYRLASEIEAQRARRRLWKKLNPEKHREQNRTHKARMRARDPEAFKAKQRERKRRQRERERLASL